MPLTYHVSYITVFCVPSSVPSPGATSPIDWVKEYVLSLASQPAPERRKILLGLNFYGYNFNASDMEGVWLLCETLRSEIHKSCVCIIQSSLLN